MTKGSKRGAYEPPASTERGIQLDVPGRALIAQAGERIAWHERNAAVLAEELKSMTLPPGPPPDIKDWTQWTRRTDVERKMASLRNAPASWRSSLVTWSAGARTA